MMSWIPPIVLVIVAAIIIVTLIVVPRHINSNIKRHLKKRLNSFETVYFEIHTDLKNSCKTADACQKISKELAKNIDTKALLIDINECFRYCNGKQDDLKNLSVISILIGIMTTFILPQNFSKFWGAPIISLLLLSVLYFIIKKYNTAEQYMDSLSYCKDIIENIISHQQPSKCNNHYIFKKRIIIRTKR